MNHKRLVLIFCLIAFRAKAALPDSLRPKPAAEISPLRFNLSVDGKSYFQATFLNQTWFRLNESNPETAIEGMPAGNSFDIGLRRTRIQLFEPLSERVFLYFQFGEYNFNAQSNLGFNRKSATFFQEALCDYRLSKGNELILGSGQAIYEEAGFHLPGSRFMSYAF
jgi:hypothetical protein